MARDRDRRFEAKDPRFEPDEEKAREAPPAGPSKWRGCLIGCLVVVLIGMLLAAAAAWWIWRNWRNLAATGATEAMHQMIDTTDLPPAERQEMKVEVERVADSFRDGKLTSEQMARIVHDVIDSPLMTIFIASAVDRQYFSRSGLSAEEKAEGRVTLRRFVRGTMDKTIPEPAIDGVLQHISDKQADGKWKLRESVSDADLRAALAEAKRVADEAKIPEQPDDVDASQELKRIVDEAMKK